METFREWVTFSAKNLSGNRLSCNFDAFLPTTYERCVVARSRNPVRKVGSMVGNPYGNRYGGWRTSELEPVQFLKQAGAWGETGVFSSIRTSGWLALADETETPLTIITL